MLLETLVLLGLSAGSIRFWYYATELYLNEKKKFNNLKNDIPPEYSELNENTELNDNNQSQGLIAPPTYDS